jgi:hypothetical protein
VTKAAAINPHIRIECRQPVIEHPSTIRPVAGRHREEQTESAQTWNQISTVDVSTQQIESDGGPDSALGHPCHLGSTFRPTAISSIDFARLFVELSATHLALHAAVLHELTEPADRVLNRLTLTQPQLNHLILLPG